MKIELSKNDIEDAIRNYYKIPNNGVELKWEVNTRKTVHFDKWIYVVDTESMRVKFDGILEIILTGKGLFTYS